MWVCHEEWEIGDYENESRLNYRGGIEKRRLDEVKSNMIAAGVCEDVRENRVERKQWRSVLNNWK